MPTSSMPIFVLSVTTRTLPWRSDPDATAHDDAVHQRDVGLGVAADVGVEQVLVPPELACVGAVAPGAVIERHDVAAGAQAALAGAGQQHRPHGVVVLPGREAFCSPSTITSLSELIAFGRLSVTTPTPLRTLTRMSSFSATIAI